jgi:DNA-binding CsgD family transcriptional regulator
MEKRINLLYIVFAFAVSLYNGYLILSGRFPEGTTLLSFYFSGPLLLLAIFIALHTVDAAVLRVIQPLTLFMVGTIGFLEYILVDSINNDLFDTMFFWILSFQLFARYDFLVRNAKAKLAVLFSGLIGLLVFGGVFIGDFTAVGSLILFFVFYFVILFFLDQETLRQYRERASTAAMTIAMEGSTFIDPVKEYGFTRREVEVGKLLVTTLGTDKEIAYDLNISVQTVVSHMTNMRRKAGVPSRQHLIDSIRGYYASLES